MGKRFTKYPRSYIHCSQIPVKELQPDMVIHDGSHDGIVERVQDVRGIDRIAVTIDGITYRFPPDDMIEILDDSEFVVDYIDPDDRAHQLTVTAKTPSDAIEIATKRLGRGCKIVNSPRPI